MVDDVNTDRGASPVPPRLPQLGALSSGIVSLLLVGALFAVPLLGLLIAPLGVLPVIHFQASGRSGVAAWGPVAALLGLISVAGLADLALLLLAAYMMIVALPALSVELWQRASWSEGRWAAVTALGAACLSLAVTAAAVWPQPPVEAAAEWMRSVVSDTGELYTAWGMAEGELELALDTLERVMSWLMPTLPVAYLVVVLFWMRPRLPLLGYEVGRRPFEEFRNDDWLAAAFAAAGLGTLVLSGGARWVCLNLLVVVLILYFIQGLAIIRAHLARWIGRGWLVRWGVVLLCLQGPIPLLVTVLGVADSFHPLRPRVDDEGGSS